LAMGSRLDPESATDMWYDEIKYTNNGRQNSFTMDTGHYTQLVWAASIYLGCGEHNGLVVCQYGPGGNMGGQFAQNVFELQKSESQCQQALLLSSETHVTKLTDEQKAKISVELPAN